MKILFLSSWYGANPPRFLADQFEDMGHVLYRVGSWYGDHGGCDWSQHKPHIDLELNRAQKWDIPHYVDQCTKAIGSPDFIVCSEESYHNEIEPVGMRIPTILLSWDGWESSFTRQNNFQSHLNYTAHPFGVKHQPRREPHPHWKFFGPACYPKVHRFLNIPRDIDFVLNATPYGPRPEICQHLRDFSLSIKDGVVTTEEYTMNANRGFATFHNSCGQIEIKYRWAEYAAMGCINIADECFLFEWLGARKHEHYFPVERIWNDKWQEHWSTGSHVYDAIITLKKNPNLAKHIQQNAMKLVLDRHTYLNRAEMILSDLEAL